MTRTEKAALAAELAHTLAPVQIARRMGVSPKYVSDLLNDPTGQRARDRQRRHRGDLATLAPAVAPAGSCRNCGCTLSSYRGLVDPNRPRLGYEVYCAPCAPRHAGYSVTCRETYSMFAGVV